MPEPISTVSRPETPAHPAQRRPAPAGTAPPETPRPADVEAVLVRYLRENFLPQGGNLRIDPADNLFDSGVLDSAAVLSVILFIEQEFAITIPDEDLLPANVASIDAAVAYIMRRLDGGPSGAPTGEATHGGDEEVPRLGSR